MREKEIEQFNKALKGEYMAIEQFDHFIHDTEQDEVKKKFQSMQQKHQAQASKLAAHIQNMGGNPVNTAGLAGVMAEIKNRVSPKKYIDGDLMKTVIEGEKIGLNALKEIRSQLTKFDNIELIDSILKENQVIYDELKQMH